MSMKETIPRKLFTGVFVAGVVALCAIWSSCGEDNCSTSEMKNCYTSEDCVLVSCSCCSYEAVSKDCTDSWYRLNDCRPGSFICPAVVCPGRIADCVKNQCVVK